jgi:sarcosine oxidase subunit alpha
MTSFDFEGRPIAIEPGDSIASALFRAGVRVYSRSFKYHRPRGMYCGTGDCPNCMMTVDGEPATRTCVTPAEPDAKVHRSSGWPSADFDILSTFWHLRPLLPVGFYYKSMIRPAGFFPAVEPILRRLAGLGEVDRTTPPGDRERRYHHPDLCVIGAGPAGLAAALAAADAGQSVVLCDEGLVGEKIVPGPLRDRVTAVAAAARRHGRITLFERGTAFGIYEGPLVPIVTREALQMVLPSRVIVATGAAERHLVVDGNDLPGVWLGRGAALMAARGVRPAQAAVVAFDREEGIDLLATLTRAGVRIAAVLVPDRLASRVPGGMPVIGGGRVVGIRGTKRVTAVVVEGTSGRVEFSCDALVASLGLDPRDNLVRQAVAASVEVMAIGDVARPGLPADEAEADGRRAAHGERTGANPAPLPAEPHRGFVCLCEDVTAADLDLGWEEGFRSTELLKRYSTATMGPCQGGMCHAHLRGFVHGRSKEALVGGPTTARPPARPVRLEDVAAGARYPLEWRTGLHDRHLEMGGVMEWAGIWRRVERYGDSLEEYRAVRERVSVMDVGTLGKYLVGGPDATAFLEQLYPCHVADIKPNRSRYALVLNEAGYVFDDGLIGSLGDGRYYLTFTSGGADVIESWLRDWAETWGHAVQIVNQTNTWGGINLCGPRARDVLAKLTSDPIDAKAIPYGGLRRATVAGVECLVLRVGFVGELSFELHHPRLQSVALWNALLEAGREFEIRPHGLDALRLLRLEKGHIIVGQDTDFDSTPHKLGLDWAVKMEKPAFVGRTALERLASIEPNRILRAFRFDHAPLEGAQLVKGGERVGYLTSSKQSPVLGMGVALGWVYQTPAGFPDSVEAIDGTKRSLTGTMVHGPFYDKEGARLRA